MTSRSIGGDPPRVSPGRQLLANRNFRLFWLAQLLHAGVNGTLRFTFIWLVVTLTDWPSAEGLVAIALGLPAMLLSLPAGAWSDRVDRKQLFIRWTAATVVVLGVFTAVIAMGWATPLWTAVAAVVIGTTMTINLPNVQAMVPLLVAPERLMHAAALQNGGAQAASFVGLAVGGLAISTLGDAGGFGVLTIVTAASVLLLTRVELPVDDAVATHRGESIVSAVISGAKFGLGHEPLRTLLLLTVMLGGSFSVMQVSMPRVVDVVYGRGSSAAGIVLGAFGIGMLISSAAVAGRSTMRHGLNVTRFVGVGLGMGQFLLSLAPNLWAAMVVMLAWGINAGVAMASHRTLVQANTPPPMMGRVMGLMMLGFAGALPIGALVSSVLAPRLGPVMTMRAVALFTMAVTIPLTFRRSIYRLR